MLSKQDILSVDDRKTEVVDVPEWGGSVRVGTMSGRQRDEYQMSMVPKPQVDAEGKPIEVKADLSNMTAKLVAMTVIDDDGAPLFTPADIAALGEKSATALERVSAVAGRLNGLTQKALEAAEKNSAAGPSAGSASA